MNSTMVGIRIISSMRVICSTPRRPRSRTRVRPPVFFSRWKRSDKRCMCSNVVSASLRTACMATRANMPSRNCASSVMQMRTTP